MGRGASRNYAGAVAAGVADTDSRAQKGTELKSQLSDCMLYREEEELSERQVGLYIYRDTVMK